MQEPESTALFRDILGCYAPGAGGEMMTHAQQLLAEGEEKGKMRAQVDMIEEFLLEGVNWSVIERATGINEGQFEAIKQQVESINL